MCHIAGLLPYFYSNERNAEHATAALRAGLFELTAEDSKRLFPPNGLYRLDIYLLLLREGYCKLEDNEAFYKAMVHYFLRLYTTAEYENHCLLPLLREVNFNTSALLFKKFVATVMAFSLLTTGTQRSYAIHPRTQVLLRSMLQYGMGREMCWTSLADEIEQELKREKEVPYPDDMRNFLLQTYVHELKAIGSYERQTQKAKMDHCKKELMAVFWHPDRVFKYLEMGCDMDDW